MCDIILDMEFKLKYIIKDNNNIMKMHLDLKIQLSTHNYF